MKKIINAIGVFAALCAIATIAFGCKQKAGETTKEAGESTIAAGSIVYFNLDRVLEEYDMANDLRSVVETKAQSITEEVNRRGSKLESQRQ